MSKQPNALLKKLMLLGVVSTAAVATGQQIVAQSSLNTTTVSRATTASLDEIAAKVEFVRAFPTSPLAAQTVEEIAILIQALPPGIRASVVSQIAATGGFPASVATPTSLTFAPTAAIAAPTAAATAPGQTSAGLGSSASIY